MRYIASVVLMILLAVPVWAEPFMSPEDVREAAGYEKTVVAKGLNHPWGMAWLPDGGLLITERPGRVLLLRDGDIRPVPGSPDVLTEGQGGLLDIAVHPDFKSNGLVYFTLATGNKHANHTALARARFDGQRFSNIKILFTVPQLKAGGQHFGSRIVWLPDGTLLMSTGDGGNPPVRVDGKLARKHAQDLKSHLGKVLRFNDDGSPVNGGAFEARQGVPELYSIGHRNIQGMAYDPIRETVWASEHGAKGGDELNRIAEGENYGWPEATYSKEYMFSLEISEYTSLPGMVDPSLVWQSGIAPSGLCLYTGDVFPQWKGDLFAGGLRGKTVRRLILDDSGNVTGEEAIPMSERVRDVRQGPDGRIYILTDQTDGKLIRLDPAER
ncbi:PQQ-dependent sugar dehydrogenase [Salidesulfovibrio brasiliensis]|uniref:PQQ-dependent sugar dehydrogenase n=1 Tax=Salidesulfovibrio brasiliensis TaxID=221711 RepID=UPI0006CF3157|nr:PQQ-dependent sugar dehydrogenase [Salidesulfovibrio brasiliensis]